jgi:peptidoglycan/LPS O-acetylase OafA/YrhL
VTTVKTDNYFPALTGIRAIAAYMVYLHHFNPLDPAVFGKRLSGFFDEFHVGVTLFFVLSGFLIGYRYYYSERSSFRNYMVNRIARIYPMFFLLTTATFLVLWFTKTQDAGETITIYLLNITFLRGYMRELMFSGIGQGWSLTVEETFYFLAPLIFIICKWKKWNVLLVPVALLTIGLIFVKSVGGVDCYGLMETNQFMFLYTFFGRGTEFMVGLGLAMFFKNKGEVLKTKFVTYIGIFFIVIFICCIVRLGNGQYSGLGHPFGILINNLLLPLFGIALLFWGLLTEKTIVSKVLGSKLFVLLGKSSYIFYLIHFGFIQIFLHKFFQNSFLIFICLNILSIILFTYIEDPLNHYLRRKLKKQEQLVAKPVN